MAKNELEIILIGKDKATAQLKKNMQNLASTGKKTSDGITKNFVIATAAIVLMIKAVDKLTKAFVNMSKNLVQVSSKVEQLQVRLKVLLGSAEKGNRVFEDMAEIAGKVPKTYDEIMEAATALAGVVRDGSKEINQLIPIIVDISAATGIAVQEVTSQIIRMYSAGAAAADLFRERGISAALGFQAGATISATETMKVIIDQWEDGTGKFVGASKELASTWVGAVSMMEDAWFTFRVSIGKELFKSAKADLNAILSIINKSKEEGGDYNRVVKQTAKFFDDAFTSSKAFVKVAIIGGGQLIDVYNDLSRNLQRIVNFYDTATIGAIKLLQVGTEAMTLGIADTSALTKEIAIRQEMLAAGLQVEIDLKEQAKIDYSTILTEQLDTLFATIEEEKLMIADAEAEKTEVVRSAEEERLALRKKVIAELTSANILFADSFKKSQIDSLTAVIKIKDQFALGVSTMFGDMVKGTFDAKKAFTDLGISIVQTLIDSSVQWLINAAIAETMQALAVSSAVATGSAVAAAWAPAAAAVSLATFGGNAAPAMAGMTAAHVASAVMAVPALAEGGIVNRPTVALIGEAGPEAVVPLNKGGGMNQTVINNIEINNPNFRNEENMEEVFEELSNMLNREAERL